MFISTRSLFPLAALLLLGACTPGPSQPTNEPVLTPSSSVSTSAAASLPSQAPQTIAENLQIPWEIAWLPNGDLLITERPGTLLRIGTDQIRHPISGVHHRGEGGLLGLALHPDFEQNQWLYLYLTTNEGGQVTNRIERYRYQDDQLTERTDILTNLPGALYHDGGRIAFGPDGYLYVATGDAQNEPSAQDTSSLAGKILRIADDGSIPADNPFGNAVYSYGHRNPQGLAWDDTGQLWSTEHGRSGISSGYDELNLITAGGNYGWPEIQGDETREGMIAPVLHSGPSVTWAPASAVYANGSVWFGGLRGEALYEAVLSGTTAELRTHLQGEYGRIRTVQVGPDNLLYITTSNTDGRGSSAVNDDRIIVVDPANFR